MQNTFKKEERLCSKIIINKLFTEGQQFHIYPFKVIWLVENKNCDNFNKVLIIVPKRLFKKAVDRNRIKRQIRNLYRLNKSILYNYFDKKDNNVCMALLYVSNEKLNYNDCNTKIISIFERLIQDYGKNI